MIAASSRHIPVLVAEVLEALRPSEGALIVDATFGAGGYTRALLDRGARVVALDRDPAAIRAGADLVAASGGRLRLVEARFGEMERIAGELGLTMVEGIAFDIGVSSMQFDEAERGFSLSLRRAARHAHGGFGPHRRRYRARRGRGAIRSM